MEILNSAGQMCLLTLLDRDEKEKKVTEATVTTLLLSAHHHLSCICILSPSTPSRLLQSPPLSVRRPCVTLPLSSLLPLCARLFLIEEGGGGGGGGGVGRQGQVLLQAWPLFDGRGPGGGEKRAAAVLPLLLPCPISYHAVFPDEHNTRRRTHTRTHTSMQAFLFELSAAARSKQETKREI